MTWKNAFRCIEQHLKKNTSQYFFSLTISLSVTSYEACINRVYFFLFRKGDQFYVKGVSLGSILSENAKNMLLTLAWGSEFQKNPLSIEKMTCLAHWIRVTMTINFHLIFYQSINGISVIFTTCMCIIVCA